MQVPMCTPTKERKARKRADKVCNELCGVVLVYTDMESKDAKVSGIIGKINSGTQMYTSPLPMDMKIAQEVHWENSLTVDKAGRVIPQKQVYQGRITHLIVYRGGCPVYAACDNQCNGLEILERTTTPDGAQQFLVEVVQVKMVVSLTDLEYISRFFKCINFVIKRSPKLAVVCKSGYPKF